MSRNHSTMTPEQIEAERQYRRQWYEANKQRVAEEQRQYREKHKERIRQQQAEYRQKNRDEITQRRREAYQKNKQQLSAKRRARYRERREKILARQHELYHERYRDHNREYLRRRYRENKDYVDALKRESGCVRCGEKDPVCLVFHHRDPNKRVASIGKLCSYTRAHLLAELAKCDILCANCHLRAHAVDGVVQLPLAKKCKPAGGQDDRDEGNSSLDSQTPRADQKMLWSDL
jgi:hypothetical protein